MPVLNALQIGNHARQLLRADAGGEVLAVVSNATYLKTDPGEIFWVGGEDLQHHKRGIQVSGAIIPPAVGTRFRMWGNTLLLGDRLGIETEGAAIWRAPEMDRSSLAPPLELPTRWVDFSRSYLPDQDEGFGALIRLIQNQVHPRLFPRNGRPLDPMQHTAFSYISRVIDCCLNADLSDALEHGRELIGLGSGLTPSGDDFLGGLLFTAHHLRKCYRIQELELSEHLHAWLAGAGKRTHAISYSLLADHAAGMGTEQLYDFVFSFISVDSIDAVKQRALRLAELGHTSGTDIVAGVLTAMLLMFNPESIISIPRARQQVTAIESRR